MILFGGHVTGWRSNVICFGGLVTGWGDHVTS